MADKMPYMPFFVNDYLSDTFTLTCEEHGAYLLLLMAMWKRSGQLDADDDSLARIVRLPMAKWKKVSRRVLPYFIIDGEKITHKRVIEQIKKVEEIKNARSEAGKRGADAKRLKPLGSEQANAVGLPQQNSSKNQPSQNSNTQIDIAIADAAKTDAPTTAETDTSSAACVAIGRKITDYMGVTDDPRWIGNWSAVSVWLAKGYDPALDIIPTVFAMVDRIKRQKKPMPGSLNYFERAIADNHRKRLDTGEAAKTPSSELVTVRKGSPEFRAWIEHYRKMGRRTAFSEKQDVLTVPSKMPPSTGVAA